jgi:CRP-like cAMP-binding protein
VEGGVADAFYVVEDGELAVSAFGERGAAAPVRLRTLGPGSYFGEIGLLGHMPRTATVRAIKPCRLLRIEGQDFLDALTNLSASPSLLEGARTRLSLTHPSKASVLDAPSPGGGGDGGPVATEVEAKEETTVSP